MPQQNISKIGIGTNDFIIKDETLTNNVTNLIEIISGNNNSIVNRINDLNNRAFDAEIKISSVNESEISNIVDGLYKVKYITITGEDDNATETLNNSAILIQKGTNQYLIKDGQISSRTKTDNTWGNWTSTISLVLSPEYEISSASNSDLALESGDTYEEAFSKLEKTIYDNEYVISSALTDLNDKIEDIPIYGTTNKLSADYIENGSTNKVINVQADWNQTIATADDYIKNKPTIPTAQIQADWNQTATTSLDYIKNKPDISVLNKINYSQLTLYIGNDLNKYLYLQSDDGININVLDDGDINLNTDFGGIYFNNKEIAVKDDIPTVATTVTQNDPNPVSGSAVYGKFEDLIGAAPAALDTLQEIASALNNDADLASTLTTQISTKIPKVSNPTVDNFASFNSDGTIKDSGLSASSFITIETQPDWNETATTNAAYIQNKPIIPDEQIQSDWNQTDDTAKDYIKNKPELPVDYSKKYLTTIALEDGIISFNIWKSIGTDLITSISYSTDDGATWTTTQNQNNKSEHLSITVNVSEGDKVLWKGDAQQTGYDDEEDYGDYVGSFFSSTAEFDVQGNLMSLLYGDDFDGETTLEYEGQFCYLFADYDAENECKVVNAKNLSLLATTLTERCYYGMFNGCTSLVTAPTLSATTLAVDCYNSMFWGCTSLTTAPELLATTLANNCYINMFGDCTSIVNAPELPATILASGCYHSMFQGCTNLVNAPTLSATTLAVECYRSMFQGCTSLVNAPTLPATTLASSCYNDMFHGCTSLVNAPQLLATTLANYCYSSMFQGCTSLVTAPTLPATTLSDYCYSSMFQGCTSLVNAPQLLATTLASSCYRYMFQGCTHLNYIKALFTTTPSGSSPNYYTQNWVSGVAASGTFVKNSAATWNVSGVNGIPNGWNIYTEDEYELIRHYEIKQTIIQNDPNPVSGSAVYGKFADLIGAAPAALDTLAEIASALNNDADLAGTLTTQISTKVPKVSSPTPNNFASFNSDGTIKDSGVSASSFITSIKTVNNESLVGTGNVVVSGLPQVSSSDNGKILMVVNGQWQLVSPSVLYSGQGVPNNAQGNNGDLYMQTD